MRQRPSRVLADRIASVPLVHQTTSSINVGELLYGALRLGDLALLDRIENLLKPLDILAFDGAAARSYAEIRVALEARGMPIGETDTRIAAIAVSRDLTVVTGNVRHFERVPGLAVENWLA